MRVLTINIYRNGRESFQTFDYIAEHGNFSWPERQGARVVGALMMWALSGADQPPACGQHSLLCWSAGWHHEPATASPTPLVLLASTPSIVRSSCVALSRMSLGLVVELIIDPK